MICIIYRDFLLQLEVGELVDDNTKKKKKKFKKHLICTVKWLEKS